MKSLRIVLASGLLAGALLVPGLANAQVPGQFLSIALNPANANGTVKIGDSILVDVFLTSDNATGIKSSQLAIGVDSTFVDVPAFVFDLGTGFPKASNNKAAVASPPGSQALTAADKASNAPIDFAIQGGFSFQQNATAKFPVTAFRLGTFTLPTLDKFGETTISLTSILNISSNAANYQNRINGTKITSAGVIAGKGSVTVKVVPGPSPLLVFATGGLAPAMALLRRRRK